MEQAHYMQIVPNSHFWTDLDMLIQTLEFDIDWYETKEQRGERIGDAEHSIVDMYEPLTVEYLITGLENTLKNGYELMYDGKTETKTQFYCNCVKNIIAHLEDGVWSPNFTLQLIKATKNNGYYLKCERKMERTEVYDRIDTERQYQDLRWTPRRAANGVADNEKPPAEWINYMEFHLTEAKNAVYHLNDEEALAQVRKVAALAVRCLELHGCPERVIPEELLNEV